MVRLFQRDYLEKNEIKKLKEVFKDMIIEIIGDFDPNNIVLDVIRKETGMGFKAYINDKTNEFMERLGD